MSRRPPRGHIVKADGWEPLFKAADDVRVAKRFTIGHYRVPTCIRGKCGRVEARWTGDPSAEGKERTRVDAA